MNQLEDGPLAPITIKALEYARQDCANRDSSHDFFHIQRTLTLATRLAKAENVENIEAVQLAAILHDVGDHKYSNEKPSTLLAKFFEAADYPAERANFVISIVEQMGFSKDFDGRAPPSPEFAVVSDADRLDAMGAVGIARAFTFGGSRNRPIYDPDSAPIEILTKEDYLSITSSKSKGPTINHFHEKLLKLSSTLNTASAREMAARRHEFMLQYLKQFDLEIKGEC